MRSQADQQACGAHVAKMYVQDLLLTHSGSHCRAFGPTWEKLARSKQNMERLTGFHMAQVNCLAQMGQCGHWGSLNNRSMQ
jgi:hypothetical protein